MIQPQQSLTPHVSVNINGITVNNEILNKKTREELISLIWEISLAFGDVHLEKQIMTEGYKLQIEHNFTTGSERTMLSEMNTIPEVEADTADTDSNTEKDTLEDNLTDGGQLDQPDQPKGLAGQEKQDQNRTDPEEPKKARAKKSARTKKESGIKNRRKDRLGNIPVEQVVIEGRFSEEWLRNHPNAKRIGPLEFEELSAKTIMVRTIYRLERVELPNEEDPEGELITITAGGQCPVLPGSKASAELRAKILFEKYESGMPLHRQANIMLLNGNVISKQDFYNWAAQTWTHFLSLIYVQLMADIKREEILFMDETRLPVNEMKSRLEKSGPGWIVEARSGKHGNHLMVVYYFRISRAQTFMNTILDMKSGSYIIHSDGYEGYFNYPNVTNVLCHDHSRRGFIKAMRVEAGFGEYVRLLKKNKDPNCKETSEYLALPGNSHLKKILEILALYKSLYMNERRYKAEWLDPEKIRERRNLESRPVLDQIYSELEKYFIDKGRPVKKKKEKKADYEQRLKNWEMERAAAREEGKTIIPAGIKLAEAIKYMQGHKESLYEYLNDGRLCISNISAEVCMKPWSRLRNNSMFCDSIKGAVMAAGVTSILKTAEMNGLKGQLYLEYVFKEMSRHKRKYGKYDEEFIKSLMPYSESLPDNLRIGSAEAAAELPPADGTIYFYNGEDPHPVAQRNPRQEKMWKEIEEKNPGKYDYHSIRLLKRRELQSLDQEKAIYELPIQSDLPQRLCS